MANIFKSKACLASLFLVAQCLSTIPTQAAIFLEEPKGVVELVCFSLGINPNPIYLGRLAIKLAENRMELTSPFNSSDGPSGKHDLGYTVYKIVNERNGWVFGFDELNHEILGISRATGEAITSGISWSSVNGAPNSYKRTGDQIKCDKPDLLF